MSSPKIVVENPHLLAAEVMELIMEEFRRFLISRPKEADLLQLGETDEVRQLREEVTLLELRKRKGEIEVEVAKNDAELAEHRAREHRAKSQVPRHDGTKAQARPQHRARPLNPIRGLGEVKVGDEGHIS